MHSSATHPVPRCVLAQTFLDNINRSSSGSSGSESNGGSSSDEDRNSDMDEKLQQSPNRLQGRQQEYRHIQVAHHLQHQPHLHQQQPHRQQYQQAQIQYHHQQQQHQHGQHGMIQQRYHHRRDDSTDLSRNDTCTLDSSNSESAGSTEIAGSCLGSRASVAGTIVFTNCNDSAPSLLPVPGISSNKNHAQEKKRQSHSHYPHQAQQNQMHDPHLQHLQQQQQQQHIEHHFGTNQHLVLPQSSALSAPQKQQPQHSSSACLPSVPSNPSPRAGVFEHQPQQQQNHRSCHSYKHSFVHSHFPPLHDIALDMVDTTMKRVDHPTLDQMLTTLKATTAASSKTAENSAISMKTLMSRTNKNKVPPPLIIPSSVGAKAVEKHQQQQQQQQQQRKVSEVPSLPSPESPSGLAIHLYVHHHHHHHSQDSKAITAPAAAQLPENSTGNLSAAVAASSSSSLALLSPLIIPLESVDASPPTLSPPSSPTHTPSTTRPLVALLPSANIPSSKHEEDHGCINSSPHLIVNRIKSLTPTEDERDQTQPWFKPPNSLANGGSSSNLVPHESHQNNIPHQNYHQRPQRQQHQDQYIRRLHQPRVRLPDAKESKHLLSTISTQDLARLYVHAAHHLHSHQPIRKYVMMKMLMTQAELTQYGRLRAEMPRPPGPSTGALPRRTGFGTEANTGLGAKAKVPSKLGMISTTMVSPHLKTLGEAQAQVQMQFVATTIPSTSLSSTASWIESLKRQETTGPRQMMMLIKKMEMEEEEQKRHRTTKTTTKSVGRQLSWPSMSGFPLNLLSSVVGRRKIYHGSKEDKEGDQVCGTLLPPGFTELDTGGSRHNGDIAIGCGDGQQQRKHIKRQDSGCYATSRRLEELELGSSSSSDDNDSSSSSGGGGGGEREEKTTRRKSLSDYHMTRSHSRFEDKEDPENGSPEMKDTRLIAEEEDANREPLVGNYWTMLRQKNNRSRRRLIRVEAQALAMRDEEQGVNAHYQQQQRQQQQPQSRVQHIYEQLHRDQRQQQQQYPQPLSCSTSFLSPPTSASSETLLHHHHLSSSATTKLTNSPKTKSGLLDRRVFFNTTVPTSSIPSPPHRYSRGRHHSGSDGSLRRMSGDDNNDDDSLHHSILGGRMISSIGDGDLGIRNERRRREEEGMRGIPGTDSIGLSSGLVMVSLLFGFLYLIEGTSQFHSLQSTLLSIIL